jgi:predicted O-methyltransferase YrrM
MSACGGVWQPDTILLLARDVRVRRRDQDWFVHFRADAPANLGFAMSDTAFELITEFASGRTVEAVVGGDEQLVAPLIDRLVASGILLSTTLATPLGLSSLSMAEVLELRCAIEVHEVGLLELEALLLYVLARDNSHPAPVCELGSMTGGSTVYLGRGVLASGNTNRVIAIDDHEWHTHLAREAHSENVARYPTTLPALRENLVRAHVDDIVDIVVGDTAAAGRSGSDALSLLFVDAGHEEPQVKADLEAWLPRVAPRSIVAIHDYGNPNWPAVQAVTDTFRAMFSSFAVSQTLAIGVKAP